jgi:hypothetical protein
MPRDRNASAKALLALLATLTDDELLVATDNPGMVKKFLGSIVAERVQNTFVRPLSDSEVASAYPQFADALASWRKLAVAMDYRGPVSWLFKKGFTLKQHAPLAGPCCAKLNYLQDWNLRNDEPTKDSIVFWVPRLAEDSTNKWLKQMEAHRAELRQKYELPASHCDRFGSIALLFALILAHFKRTGERVPLGRFDAASDTLRAGDGYRLSAGGFDESGLSCCEWRDDYGEALLGFFLLGVEDLG